jgi:ribonuclease P protein component
VVPHQSNHPDYGLSRERRLKSSRLLQETFAQGCRFAGRSMILWLRSGAGSSMRLGVVAGRTVGGAVERNRARRRLREAFRLNRHRFQGQCDVVLMARDRIHGAAWPELQAELIALAGKAGILKR